MDTSRPASEMHTVCWVVFSYRCACWDAFFSFAAIVCVWIELMQQAHLLLFTAYLYYDTHVDGSDSIHDDRTPKQSCVLQSTAFCYDGSCCRSDHSTGKKTK